VLRELLDSLATLTRVVHEVIVVDNCSDDDTEKIVRGHDICPSYIRLEKNIGAAARNYGLKKASADIVITLDDDITGLDEAAINTIKRIFESNPGVGAVNFQIKDYYNGRICNWPHHKKEEEYADKVFRTCEITEGAVAFRSSAVEKAGYYAEYFFLSHEGPDLVCRMLDSGYDIIYAGDVSVRHKHESAGRKSWYNYYYDTRNIFWLAVRNYPVLYAIRYAMRGATVMMIYALRDGYFTYWMKGIFDGLAGMRKVMRDRRVISDTSLATIKGLLKDRPDTFYYLQKRIFQKSARL